MKKHRLLRTAITLYCLLSLPVVLVFLKSEYVRYQTIQMVTHWKATAFGIKEAHIGDSITAGGRNWGSPFNSLNFGGNGYTAWQIEKQIPFAAKFSPARIFILAGTNDILGKRPFDPFLFEQDYLSLITRATETKARIIVTLIPYTTNAKYTASITAANQIILKLTHDRGIATLDLNKHIAPNGTLDPKYTVDGVHLNTAAYTIWKGLIKSAITNHSS
jgi:lysophospholipase L1-like esterase